MDQLLVLRRSCAGLDADSRYNLWEGKENSGEQAKICTVLETVTKLVVKLGVYFNRIKGKHVAANSLLLPLPSSNAASKELPAANSLGWEQSKVAGAAMH